MTLTDIDRTQNKKHFNVVVCPTDDRQQVKDFIELMEYISVKQRKLKLTLMGRHAHKVYSEHLDKTDILDTLDFEMKHNPDFMRHLVVCEIDISPIVYNKLSNALMGSKENDSSYQVVSNYCPTCRRKHNGGLQQ
jgi:hypothetical protein